MKDTPLNTLIISAGVVVVGWLGRTFAAIAESALTLDADVVHRAGVTIFAGHAGDECGLDAPGLAVTSPGEAWVVLVLLLAGVEFTCLRTDHSAITRRKACVEGADITVKITACAILFVNDTSALSVVVRIALIVINAAAFVELTAAVDLHRLDRNNLTALSAVSADVLA